MKLAKGVEWAAHASALLAVLPDAWSLSAEALADYHKVPPAYMAKQMQALSKVGLVISQRGAIGGYRLARPPSEITLWDITAAIEGTAPSFHCTEIRQNGPCGAAAETCKRPCGIAASFYRAEQAFRDVLRAVTLADLIALVAADTTPDKASSLAAWVQDNAARLES